jgi:DNA topoisomerase-1
MDHKLFLSDPGIFKRGNKFYYNKTKEKVSNPSLLDHLKKYRVPPAWENVWYASNPRCHIHVHGIDGGGKKQYILSPKWINNSKAEKFNRAKSFIKELPGFKRKIRLNHFELTKENVIYLLFNLLIDTHIRVGNEIYARSNDTYGLTTLRQKHLKNGCLDFVGKSHIKHCVPVPENYLSLFEKLKRNNRNDPLFYYIDGSKIKTISSEELNQFLKENMGNEYTCKDFRTYSANILFIKAFLKNAKEPIAPNKIKRLILKSIESSAADLGHTRSISRKSYISENLIDYLISNFEKAKQQNVTELLNKI